MIKEPVSRWVWDLQMRGAHYECFTNCCCSICKELRERLTVQRIEELMMYRGVTPEEENLLRELIHTATADARQEGIKEKEQPGESRGVFHFLLNRFPVPSLE